MDAGRTGAFLSTLATPAPAAPRRNSRRARTVAPRQVEAAYPSCQHTHPAPTQGSGSQEHAPCTRSWTRVHARGCACSCACLGVGVHQEPSLGHVGVCEVCVLVYVWCVSTSTPWRELEGLRVWRRCLSKGECSHMHAGVQTHGCSRVCIYRPGCEAVPQVGGVHVCQSTPVPVHVGTCAHVWWHGKDQAAGIGDPMEPFHPDSTRG